MFRAVFEPDNEPDLDLVLDLVADYSRRRSRARIIFSSVEVPPYNRIRGDLTMFTITDSQKTNLAINPVDKKGNPAKVDGAPAWAVSDETLATLQPAADGLSAGLFANGPLGTFQVTVSADADLGEGIATISGVLDVEVIAGAAASLAISAGPAEEQ
jgi:hypothetical protein